MYKVLKTATTGAYPEEQVRLEAWTSELPGNQPSYGIDITVNEEDDACSMVLDLDEARALRTHLSELIALVDDEARRFNSPSYHVYWPHPGDLLADVNDDEVLVLFATAMHVTVQRGTMRQTLPLQELWQMLDSGLWTHAGHYEGPINGYAAHDRAVANAKAAQ